MRRFLALTTLALGAVLLTLVLIEGLASTVITIGLLFGSSGRFAQERYARYDPELGWASLPNVDIPDMYGPAAALHTDARGFRGRTAPATTPPADRVRIVCSGDSFTFGYGVADEHTWCALLGELDPRIESINMGQGGYGVDQAFLWYRRDGAGLAPAIHLFTFIDGDFERMRSDRFLDYGKPTLALRAGVLQAENVPAPRRRFWVPTVRVLDIVKRTKSYELFDRLVRRGGGGVAPPDAPTAHPADAPARAAIEQVALAVFAELQAMTNTNGGTLVLVYLPIAADCHMPPGAATGLAWWRSLGPRTREQGFRVIDLSDDCRRLAASELDALFFREGDLRYYGAAGHYTDVGNRFFATKLYAKLRPLVDAAAASSQAAPRR